MSDDLSHLSPKAQEYLAAPIAQRLEVVRREKWIDYAAAKAILDDLNDLLDYPERNRMPCRLIIAESNNGKSSLLKHFRTLHPPDPNLSGETVKIPVLFAVLNGPDVRMMCQSLLSAMFEQLPRTVRTADLLAHLISVLQRVHPKMIMLDEVNTIISGSSTKTRECFNALKFMTNVTGIPIVAAGTREALQGFKTDEQMENRFEPRRLNLWEKGKELRLFLRGYEMLTPLRLPSGLHSPEMSVDILNRTGGAIGEMASLITKAATYAIRKETEQITLDALDNCGYVPMSRRRHL